MKNFYFESGAAMCTSDDFAKGKPEFAHGFFWTYAAQPGGPRGIGIQAVFASQITAPVPAFMDDFGTLVAIREQA